MSQVAKLKKQAAEFEAKKQFDKAIGAYIKLLESFDAYADELDIGLFNRVGDLLIRQGNVADAVDFYERGIDKYSDTGFFNNAIALCNKVLRHSPGRASIYYKLGRISAKKGFTNEARTNFLEYADRMQKSGKVDEAFRALTEFADLCPDQDEIRLTLAEQLMRAGRKSDALEQLQILHERLDGEGRANDARAVVDRHWKELGTHLHRPRRADLQPVGSRWRTDRRAAPAGIGGDSAPRDHVASRGDNLGHPPRRHPCAFELGASRGVLRRGNAGVALDTGARGGMDHGARGRRAIAASRSERRERSGAGELRSR
jgi:hypothetical protein